MLHTPKRLCYISPKLSNYANQTDGGKSYQVLPHRYACCQHNRILPVTILSRHVGYHVSFKFTSTVNYLEKPEHSDTHRVKSAFFPCFNFKKRSRAIAQTCILQRPKSLTAGCISGREEGAGSASCRPSGSLIISACLKSTHTHTHIINAFLGVSKFSLFTNLKDCSRMFVATKQTM